MTKNSEATLERALAPLSTFDEVLILDTGSTDQTLSIAARFANVRILHQDGIGHFGATRNKLTGLAKHDWVLHIDSDEFLTEESATEIAGLVLEPNHIYEIRERLFYRGKALPTVDAWKARLYHRGTTDWTHRAVHESLLVPKGATVIRLEKFVEHHSSASVLHFVRKSLVYGELFAEQAIEGQKKKGSALRGVLHGLAAFVKYYFLRRCFWYGHEGFVCSFHVAFSSFIKYVILYEKQQDKGSDST